MVYTYQKADGTTEELPVKLKEAKDERPYIQRHPVKMTVNKVRGVIMWCAPFWSLAYGVYTAVNGN